MQNILKSLPFNIMIAVIIIFCNHAQCAETGKNNITQESFFTEVSLITGFGSGNIPEGRYQPILLAGHFGINLKRYFSKLENHGGTLSFFVEPQFNTVVNPKTDLECGIGIGIQYMYPLTEKLSTYLMGSIGPHYFSAVTREQANGFIFSDSIGAGVYYHVTKNSALSIGYRFRHLSNARLEMPNNGINTHFATVGFSLFFE